MTHPYRSPESRSPSPPARRLRATSPTVDDKNNKDEDDQAPLERERRAAPSTSTKLFNIPKLHDADQVRRQERERQMNLALAASELAGGDKPKPVIDLRAEMKKMVNTKGGGAYVPPHRMRAMMEGAEEEDRAGAEFQRLVWEALRKSINGLINKVNISNIKMLVPEVRQFYPFDSVTLLTLRSFFDSFSCLEKISLEDVDSLCDPS